MKLACSVEVERYSFDPKEVFGVKVQSIGFQNKNIYRSLDAKARHKPPITNVNVDWTLTIYYVITIR